MQTFIDTATSNVWQFEDDVVVTDTAGVYSFKTAAGVALNSPATLQPYTIPAPTPTQLAATAAQAQTAAMQAAYQSAINAPVSFKNAAGITSTYAFGNATAFGETKAQDLLMQIIGAGTAAWTAGVWFDTTGKMQAMTFADLQGLAAAIEAMETPDEQTLMAKIASIQAIQNLPARVASTAYTASQQIVDTNGNVWTASAGTTGTTCTFPTSPAIGATKTDGSVTWTFAGSQVALIEGVTW